MSDYSPMLRMLVCSECACFIVHTHTDMWMGEGAALTCIQTHIGIISNMARLRLLLFRELIARSRAERMWPTKRAALNIINLELFPGKIDNDGLNRNKESHSSQPATKRRQRASGLERQRERQTERARDRLLSTSFQSARCPPLKCSSQCSSL